MGFVVNIESLDGKLKLSQNRPMADRRGVVAGLRASERAADQSTADEVERQIGPFAAVRQNS